MTAKELIESGIIELYCLGIADGYENSLVEHFAATNHEIADEIAEVSEALAMFSIASAGIRHPKGLKENFLSNLQDKEKQDDLPQLPPKITSASRPGEWMEYLHQHQIKDPAHQAVAMVVLPGTKNYFTYVVFASPGGIVDEEMHQTHDEFLLICQGECEMTIGENTAVYKAGSLITITLGIHHSARILGKKRMIAIGQRRAA